jgi:hypothetical protein
VPHPWRLAAWAALGYGAVLFGSLALAILYYPQFLQNVGSFRALAPLPVLKDLVGAVETGGLWAYVAGQQYFKGCNSLGAPAAALFACGAIAGEANRGTLEIWLARPLSRLRLYAVRYVAGALALCLPVFATSWSIPWLMQVADVKGELSYALLTRASVHQSALLLAIYSLTFALSAAGRHPLRIAFWVLFATTAMFALYLIDRVTHWSLFRLTDVHAFLRIQRSGALDPVLLGSMLAASALFAGAGWFVFRRRLPV